VIPDAIRAVITAVMEEHPGACPDLLARLIVAELRDLGWHITARPPAPALRSAS
jgi:hypothetical protein